MTQKPRRFHIKQKLAELQLEMDWHMKILKKFKKKKKKDTAEIMTKTKKRRTYGFGKQC